MVTNSFHFGCQIDLEYIYFDRDRNKNNDEEFEKIYCRRKVR